MQLKVEKDVYVPPKHGLRLLLICILIFFLVFCARFWYLQVLRGDEFTKLSIENRMRSANTFAARGEIYDINGLILAENHIAFAITLVRENISDIDANLAQISKWTGEAYGKIQERFDDGKKVTQVFEPIILAQDLSFEKIASIQTELINWPGIEIIPRPIRNYPQKDIVAHIMGYVAEAKKDELQKDEELDLGDIVGRQGIELTLESELRGDKGLRIMEVDSGGRILQSDIIEEAKAGNNIVLNIDVGLQRNISEIMGEYSGSVVVLDPDTGAIKAFVTKPSYDNNLFVTGFSQYEWNLLREHPRFPLQNRTIQSSYPPGSVWKLMMAALLLENGVSPKEKVFCGGRHEVGNRSFRCWNEGGHGNVDMEKAIVASCDVYFFEMSERYGIDKIEEFAKKSGFGKRTGIDLPHENTGLVPSRDWKLKRINEKWQVGDTINTSIGQGFTLVTPLQMAVHISALINGGNLLKPQLIAHIPPTVVGKLPVQDANLDLIRQFMINTVEFVHSGATARVLNRPDMTIGAKTGTAQVVKLKLIGTRRLKNEEADFYERDHAWMGSFGEKDGKRYVIVTMLEHGGGGGSSAGPVTKAIYELLFPIQTAEAEKE